jgi:hypothetical protein
MSNTGLKNNSGKKTDQSSSNDKKTSNHSSQSILKEQRMLRCSCYDLALLGIAIILAVIGLAAGLGAFFGTQVCSKLKQLNK